jgi:sialic acid synthase SpsE
MGHDMIPTDVQCIAEFTTNSFGHTQLLLAMGDAAKQAGADLIKMQKKDVDTFYSPEKLASNVSSPFGKVYQQHRQMFEHSEDDWRLFLRRCFDLRMGWFATVQDLPSLRFVQGHYPTYIKIASVNSRNHDFISNVVASLRAEQIVVISVAGSTIDDIKATLDLVPNHRVIIQHCVAQYPCPPEALRLGNITVLKHMFESERVKIGYSGHETGIAASVVAAHLGAHTIERHFCLSRNSFVHHIECALEPEEFAKMSKTIKLISQMSEQTQHVATQPYYNQLPVEAFRSDFGMTSAEEQLLVRHEYNTYGPKVEA